MILLSCHGINFIQNYTKATEIFQMCHLEKSGPYTCRNLQQFTGQNQIPHTCGEGGASVKGLTRRGCYSGEVQGINDSVKWMVETRDLENGTSSKEIYDIVLVCSG